MPNNFKRITLAVSMTAFLSAGATLLTTPDVLAKSSVEVQATSGLDLSKVILVKDNSKIEVDFFTYIDAVGNVTVLNGYQIQYLISESNKTFELMDYIDYYASGNTPADVINKLQTANKSITVSDVVTGGFVNGKLNALEEDNENLEIEDID